MKDRTLNKVIIVGFGSVGSLITYALNKSGVKPHVVVRDRNKLRVLASSVRKLVVQGEEIELNYNLMTYEDIPNVRYVDLVFICTKAYDFENAFNRFMNIIKSCGGNFKLLITCQNGIGSFEYAVNVLGRERTASLVINHGVYKVSTHKYVYVGGGESYLGQSGGLYNDLLYSVAELLKDLHVHVVSDIEPYRWLKLLINAGINSITTILNSTNGVIVSNEYARRLALIVVNEGRIVAERLGIKLPKDPLKELIKVAEKTRNNYSSMLQDIINRRKTEVDYINGAIVRLAKKVGVEAKVNETLLTIIKSLESKVK